MIDVGAHVGSSARFFNALGWRIYCFEPDAENRAKLVARFSDRDNISIDPRAVAERPARKLPFFTSEESSGISGLHAFRDTHKQTATVDVTTVAEIVNNNELTHVDFLKIDVEGFDLAVLKGVPWQRIKPDVIECEFEDAKTVRLGHTYAEVAKFLIDKGYTVYLSEWHPIIRYGIPHDWCRVIAYPEPLLSSQAWGNILAFRDDPGIGALRRTFDLCLKRRTSSTSLPAIKAEPREGAIAPMKRSQASPAIKYAQLNNPDKAKSHTRRLGQWSGL